MVSWLTWLVLIFEFYFFLNNCLYIYALNALILIDWSLMHYVNWCILTCSLDLAFICTIYGWPWLMAYILGLINGNSVPFCWLVYYILFNLLLKILDIFWRLQFYILILLSLIILSNYLSCDISSQRVPLWLDIFFLFFLYYLFLSNYFYIYHFIHFYHLLIW